MKKTTLFIVISIFGFICNSAFAAAADAPRPKFPFHFSSSQACNSGIQEFSDDAIELAFKKEMKHYDEWMVMSDYFDRVSGFRGIEKKDCTNDAADGGKKKCFVTFSANCTMMGGMGGLERRIEAWDQVIVPKLTMAVLALNVRQYVKNISAAKYVKCQCDDEKCEKLRAHTCKESGSL